MRWLRSTLYNTAMVLTMVPYALLSLLTAPLPFAWRYAFITKWGRFQVWLARHVLGIHFRVEGVENLPPGPAVILAKHQSAWETFAFQQLFPPFVWILKRELLWIPLFGWGLALLKPIAIDRGAGRLAMEQVVTQGRARLAQGLWVVVFPEGTRTAPGTRARYKIGGAVLAVEAGVLAVPVAHNAGRCWPRRGFLKRPGTITVAIGPPIPTQGRRAEDVTRDAETWIESTLERVDGSRA